MPLPAGTHDTLERSKRDAIDALLAKRHRGDEPGCAVGVYRHGTVLYSGAFGLADVSSGKPLTPSTAVNIGSIAKQMTAAAILLLAQDGKLSVEDDIRTYLPELPDHGARVTIRQLLTHTSGIRDYRGLLNLAGHRNSEQVSAARILSVMARQRGLNFRPGDQYQYSNSGYFLAAMIVERVTEESFSKFTRQRIFEPLGMSRARYKGDTAGLWPLAIHYAPLGNGRFEPFEERWEEIGGGDLYTSVEDLARWDGNFHSGVVGGERLVRAIETPGALANGKPLKYAMGLEHATLRGHPSIGHGGNSGGSAATLKRFPEARLSVAVLCNRADGPADALASDIAAFVLPPARAAVRSVLPDIVTSRASAPPTTWVGSYRAPGNSNVVSVYAEGEGLGVKLGGARLPLRLVGGDVYQVTGAPMDVYARFERAKDTGQRRLIPVDSDDPPMDAFEPATPTAADLAGYAGVYTCPEIQATIGIRAKAGTLVASMPLGKTMSLQPLERGAFAAPNLVFEFDDAVAGKTPGFRLDQWRARGMRCNRAVGSKPSP